MTCSSSSVYHQPTDTQVPLAITMGDPAGISPEIIVKLFAAGVNAPVVIYGDHAILQQTASQLGLSNVHLPVVQACHAVPPIQTGVVQAVAGQAAFECLHQAIHDAMQGKIRGIVTAPLNKEALHLAGHPFPGHTEILAHYTHTPHVSMMLANQDLRIILVTIHEALRQVPDLLSVELECQTIAHAWRICRQMGIEQPRIAVAGFNPHAGENGRFGDEEQRFITPAITQMQQQGIVVTGPYPGDTVFMQARQGEFDIVVAQYHDQGLIPIKYLGLDEGVNITVGLPFIRTSVDHGTAFNIAGQGRASPDSLRCALDFALRLSS